MAACPEGEFSDMKQPEAMISDPTFSHIINYEHIVTSFH